MCIPTFENLDVATVYHAFSRFKCWNSEKTTCLKHVDNFEATRYEATRYEATCYEATRYEATRYEATRYEVTRYEATRYEATRL